MGLKCPKLAKGVREKPDFAGFALYLVRLLAKTRQRCEGKYLNMKKTYHLCLSAGEEVMFRDAEDYNRGFNCFALALFNTDTTGLVESEMSTHYHQLIQSANPNEFMRNFRLSYSMYFNRKYHRSGKLGEKHHYTMEVVGYNHICRDELCAEKCPASRSGTDSICLSLFISKFNLYERNGQGAI